MPTDRGSTRKRYTSSMARCRTPTSRCICWPTRLIRHARGRRWTSDSRRSPRTAWAMGGPNESSGRPTSPLSSAAQHMGSAGRSVPAASRCTRRLALPSRSTEQDGRAARRVRRPGAEPATASGTADSPTDHETVNQSGGGCATLTTTVRHEGRRRRSRIATATGSAGLARGLTPMTRPIWSVAAGDACRGHSRDSGRRGVSLRRVGIGCDAGLNRRPRRVQMSVRRVVRALIVALLVLLAGAGSASAATDHVVVTGGAVVPAGQTAGDVVVLDGTVRIAGRATGDVVSVSGPVRVSGRIDGDLIAVSDRAFLGPTARVGGDLRYGDERPVLVRGARVDGEISNEDWADVANGWGWLSLIGWWLAVSVSTLIVGALLVVLAPAALYAAERAVRERLGATVAWGVAIAIGVPLLAVLALVTLVGIPFGIALFLAAIPVLLVAYVTSAWIVGRRMLRNRSTSPWAALFVGWGILRVLALIPVAGALVGLAATVVGLGALAVALLRARAAGAPPAGAQAPPPGRPAPAA